MKKEILLSFLILNFTFIMLAQTAVQPAGSVTYADPYKIATLNTIYWVTQNSSSWAVIK